MTRCVRFTSPLYFIRLINSVLFIGVNDLSSPPATNTSPLFTTVQVQRKILEMVSLQFSPTPQSQVGSGGL